MHDLTRRQFMITTAAFGAGAALRAPGDAHVNASEAVYSHALSLGHACHAFEHLGGFGMQAEAAAACGATVIYATGIGGDGYEGLPAPDEWQRRLDAARAYTEKAKGLGIPLALGYLCATSIVGLDDFDAHWTPEFRALFKTPPREWLQKDIDGNPLPSWYGGAYQPACMNHPDWRAYEKEMIRFQIQTGHGGIFFDNPTVHPKGCYCEHCMVAFGKANSIEGTVVELRQLASDKREDDFRRFRSTVGRDFFEEMGLFARSLDPHALITANNSTNAPSVLYSQCSLYGYSPYEMSKSEDFVVVEDMSHQPRTTDDGKVFEYGPTIRQLQALCHGKPLVVCTIAEADYHTPPNLMRLAMAECAANQATYMVWSTWPEEHRARLSAAARKQVDFLRQNANTYVGTHMCEEMSLYLPIRDRWRATDRCRPSEVAAEMTRANVQYAVFTEDELDRAFERKHLVVEDRLFLEEIRKRQIARNSQYCQSGGHDIWPDAISNPNEKRFASSLLKNRLITIENAPNVRAYAHEAPGAIYIHLLNLDIRKRDSFNDEIFPASNFKIQVDFGRRRHTLKSIESAAGPPVSLESLTADENTTRGTIPFTVGEVIHRYSLTFPLLEVSAILAIKLGTA